jgi:hypothetical protein
MMVNQVKLGFLGQTRRSIGFDEKLTRLTFVVFWDVA